MKLTSLILFFAIFISTGCQTEKFYWKQEVEKPGRVPTYSVYRHFFIWGLAQSEDLNLKDACKGKEVSYVETKYTPLSMLVIVLTYTLYSPKLTNVYCELE
ncbi:Bor family protein [Leptospira noguchii]|uniref:Bor protein n=2 Tax=Leptospira noguchii TaxID=28182 RepID=T0H0C3_9LEPT|nr:Bor family protein [Leptospira noguchii]EMO28412.1 bor protein [Leptospira interrogans serovar Bataviae str. HAI135]EMO52583.1 bor protein [Leptospira noguchii]EQA72941.1 bor protein [Leptospira noguchii serovar Panama str. CZ214]MCH1913589.1 Bor family protein [Leptospira noguchii]MCH1915125.1 Bor family protein [Leptospira noguchii]